MGQADEDDEQALVRGLLEQRPDEPLPDGFTQRLAERLDREPAGDTPSADPVQSDDDPAPPFPPST